MSKGISGGIKRRHTMTFSNNESNENNKPPPKASKKLKLKPLICPEGSYPIKHNAKDCPYPDIRLDYPNQDCCEEGIPSGQKLPPSPLILKWQKSVKNFYPPSKTKTKSNSSKSKTNTSKEVVDQQIEQPVSRIPNRFIYYSPSPRSQHFQPSSPPDSPPHPPSTPLPSPPSQSRRRLLTPDPMRALFEERELTKRPVTPPFVDSELQISNNDFEGVFSGSFPNPVILNSSNPNVSPAPRGSRGSSGSPSPRGSRGSRGSKTKKNKKN
jgi:hypothetical protein